jgi:RecA-family ATPase
MAIHKKAAVSYGNDWLQTFAQPIPWIWEGVVALEAVTLLAAPEKTGKTTLLSLLLDRRREGGQLLGRMVQPGRTILCSEENDRL